MMVMAIAPGAPVALRRSLAAGADRDFAPGLQVTIALLAVISMPLSLALLDGLYAASATISPWHLLRQVLLAQFLPLALGVAPRTDAWPSGRLAASPTCPGRSVAAGSTGAAGHLRILERVDRDGAAGRQRDRVDHAGRACRRACPRRSEPGHPHGRRDLDRAAQSRARAAGRGLEFGAAGRQGDHPGLPGRDRPDGHAVRNLALAVFLTLGSRRTTMNNAWSRKLRRPLPRSGFPDGRNPVRPDHDADVHARRGPGDRGGGPRRRARNADRAYSAATWPGA